MGEEDNKRSGDYCVILVNYNDKELVKAKLSEMYEVTSEDAGRIMSSLPIIIQDGLPEEDAKLKGNLLEDAGAVINITNSKEGKDKSYRVYLQELVHLKTHNIVCEKKHMNQHLLQDIRGKMRPKPTEELVQIWETHDKTEWSDEAFESIREILTERGVPLPAQKVPKAKAEDIIVKCTECGEANKSGILRCTKCKASLCPFPLAVITSLGIIFSVLLAIWSIVSLVQAWPNFEAIAIFGMISVPVSLVFFGLRNGYPWAWFVTWGLLGFNIAFSTIMIAILASKEWMLDTDVRLILATIRILINGLLWCYISSKRVKAFCSVGK